ncbi:MAG: 50S ribosomal protein L20 [bacterium]
MSRVKTSVASKRRKMKILKMAKGFRGARGRLYRVARDSVHRALAYSYRDRRVRKRDFRRLWICRINAAARMHGISYSLFMQGLKKAGITMNRKVLAELAVNDPSAFAEIAGSVKQHLSN